MFSPLHPLFFIFFKKYRHRYRRHYYQTEFIDYLMNFFRRTNEQEILMWMSFCMNLILVSFHFTSFRFNSIDHFIIFEKKN